MRALHLVDDSLGSSNSHEDKASSPTAKIADARCELQLTTPQSNQAKRSSPNVEVYLSVQ